MIKSVLLSGMERGDLRTVLEAESASFACWGMLAGLIQFASSKEEYIKQSMGLSKEQFLQYGFDMLYHSIAGSD